MRVAIACRERSDLSFMYLVARPNLYGTQNHPWFWSYNPDLGTLFDKVTLDEFFHNLRTIGPVKDGLKYVRSVLYPGPKWEVKFITEKEIKDVIATSEAEMGAPDGGYDSHDDGTNLIIGPLSGIGR